METPLLKYAAILRAARKDAGLTQQEVADYVGVSTVTVYYWETGKRVPNEENAQRLRKLYASYIQDSTYIETFNNMTKKELINTLIEVMEENE